MREVYDPGDEPAEGGVGNGRQEMLAPPLAGIGDAEMDNAALPAVMPLTFKEPDATPPQRGGNGEEALTHKSGEGAPPPPRAELEDAENIGGGGSGGKE